MLEFNPADQAAWTGNFQPGLTGMDAVVDLPGASDIVVVAGGQGYVIEPTSRRCTRTFGGQIEDVFPLPDCLVFSNGLWMEATGSEGLRWRTRRISWDGFRSVALDGHRASGEAWSPIDGEWVPFSVDLRSGEVSGGSFPLE